MSIYNGWDPDDEEQIQGLVFMLESFGADCLTFKKAPLVMQEVAKYIVNKRSMAFIKKLRSQSNQRKEEKDGTSHRPAESNPSNAVDDEDRELRGRNSELLAPEKGEDQGFENPNSEAVRGSRSSWTPF